MFSEDSDCLSSEDMSMHSLADFCVEAEFYQKDSENFPAWRGKRSTGPAGLDTRMPSRALNPTHLVKGGYKRPVSLWKTSKCHVVTNRRRQETRCERTSGQITGRIKVRRRETRRQETGRQETRRQETRSQETRRQGTRRQETTRQETGRQGEENKSQIMRGNFVIV